MYQKLQRYQDDKKYLYGLHLKDLNKEWPIDDKDFKRPYLDFQNENARAGFLRSIPDYIKDDFASYEDDHDQKSELSEQQPKNFMKKLKQIEEAIKHELELYDMLKELKKVRNQNKRLPLKKQAQ
jgi:hypothetical protein